MKTLYMLGIIGFFLDNFAIAKNLDIALILWRGSTQVEGGLKLGLSQRGSTLRYSKAACISYTIS